jgi:hypothetical protein
MPPPQSSSEALAPGVTLQPDLGPELDSSARTRRLLIVSKNLASLRGHYEGVIVAFAHVGVHVGIRYSNDKGLAADQYRETLLRRDCRVALHRIPSLGRDPGDLLALRVRQLASLLRFYHPDFRERGALRARVVKAAAGPQRWALRVGRLGSAVPSWTIRLESMVDRLLSPSDAAKQLVEGTRRAETHEEGDEDASYARDTPNQVLAWTAAQAQNSVRASPRAPRQKMESSRPRLLIVSRQLAPLRTHYEDVIVALVEAGVEVTVRHERSVLLSGDDYRATLSRRGCSVRVIPLGRVKLEGADRFSLRLRQLANLLRFYHPDYRDRSLREAKLRKSVKSAVGPMRWARRIGRLGSPAAGIAIGVAGSIDRVLPPSESARALIDSEEPSAVVVIDALRSPVFVDIFKAAARRHVTTATWIESWDNLTTRGLLNYVPDRVFVWNEVQRDELMRYHGIPENHVCVTGAQTFDHWFNGDTPADRLEFCSENGLDSERPIILYVASARQAEVSPADFFLRWLEAVRTSGDQVLESSNVLLRPHPTNMEPWLELTGRHPGLVVSPGAGVGPIGSPEFRTRYRDELHHTSVAVGLNTTGLIDAAIFGKPACTVELPDLVKGQRGYVHFEYLEQFAGGLLRSAPNLEEHVQTLAELVRRDPYERDDRADRFAQAFARPHGLDVPASRVFVDAMLDLLQSPAQPRLPSPLGRTIGRLIHRAAPLLGAPLEDGTLRRWALRWQAFLTKLVTSWRTFLTRLITAWWASLTKLITSLR